MRLRRILAVGFSLWALALASPAGAQEAAPDATTKAPPPDIIMPHITDSKQLEYPCFVSIGEWACHVTLPVWPVTIRGHTYDFGPTKHVVFMLLSATLVSIVLIGTARAHARHSHAVGRPKGFAAGLEAVILYLRQTFIPMLGGHGGEKYVPFVLTLFFFILVCNLFGLIPYGSTATGNVSVTATLAIITFIVIEAAGMKALGAGYFNTIVFWPKDLALPIRMGMTVIMTPIELLGKFTKPFALAIRLFANMLAGHVIILALISIIFTFGWIVAPAPLAMALFIMFLEIAVSFIQAFVFALLAAVFIGQIRSAHH